ncbi:unnamed protein product, partial [Symbiodinium sp. CCMP2456]
SRHAYGVPWHQGPGLPTTHGNSAGEAYPKKVPSYGCFNGVPGDVPPEKRLWYIKGAGMEFAGTSSLYGRGRDSGNMNFKATNALSLSQQSAMSRSSSSPNI